MSRVNGAESSAVSVLDRGLHFADGVFETIAYINGQPRLWDRHMARLAAGCDRLGISAPDAGFLRAEADRARSDATRTIVKIMVTRGSGPSGVSQPTTIATSRDWPADLDARRHDGVVAHISDVRISRNPRVAGIKHLNRLEYVLAENDRRPDEARETILRDTHGYLIETCRANIFLVRDGRLYTPDLRYAGVCGVMRAEILALAKSLGIAASVAWFMPRTLFGADEVFVTNAVMGVCPVRRIEEQAFTVGPVTRTLQEALA